MPSDKPIDPTKTGEPPRPLQAIERGNVVVADGRPRSLGELGDGLEERLRQAGWAGTPVAVRSAQAVDLVAAAAMLASTGLPGAILYDDEDGRRAGERLRALGHAVFDAGTGALDPAVAEAGAERMGMAAADGPSPAGAITLLTSGTTGEPKQVQHSWASLRTWRPSADASPQRWLVTYRPGSYAWYQLVVLALFVRGHSLVLGRDLDPQRLLAAGKAARATAVSSTPTFWRWAFLNAAPQDLDLPLRQVSLGGERVDQALLDRLRTVFPRARVTHIYASTEAGASLVVNDGREGFPIEWLGRPLADGRVEVRVEDGTLRIRSAHAARSQPTWIDTGDLVEVRGDRVLVLGRAATSFVNVGGVRAVLPEIERLLLAHPAIAWCRVYGRKAPVVGTLLAAEVVLRPGKSATEQELAAHLRGQVAEPLVPRLIRFRPDIPMTSNQKSALASP